MQKDINQVVFTARLTKDPELRETPSGNSVATLRVAIGRPDGKDGQDRGAAFYDVEVWNGLAKRCARYLAKGRRILVSGRLEHQQWEDDKDVSRQRNYVVAGQVNFLDPAPKDEERQETEAEG